MIDIKKVVAKPPETFMNAQPFNLTSGENMLDNYNIPKEYIAVFHGFSFAQQSGVRFWIDVDNIREVIRLDDLGPTRGLDYEEDIKFPATKSVVMKAYSPSAINGFQWRYKVTVFKPTTALKILLGLPLTSRDNELDRKFGITNAIKSNAIKPYDPLEGIEELRTATITLSSSGNILSKTVPVGKKLVLINISTVRPTSAGVGTITVQRDDITNVLSLDPYCLNSLQYNAIIRIVALENLRVDFTTTTSGTYQFRVVYGIGRLTIPEKIKWGIPLTSDEKLTAEEHDMFEKIEAGIL